MPGEVAIKMEPEFYEDSTPNWIQNKKRSMTLDFNGLKTKKNAVLSTPDVQMLKLASPELEKMIINHQGNVCTTPTPTQFICPKIVTEEQSAFAQGFVEALQSLHEKSSVNENSVEDSLDVASAVESAVTTLQQILPTAASYTTQVSSTCYNNHNMVSSSTIPGVSVSHPVYSSAASPEVLNTNAINGWSDAHHLETLPPNTIKQEPVSVVEPPQTVPVYHASNAPSLSPIDMETQERIKAERKRLRNRIAASKCRRRKLERIAHLEKKVSELKSQNSDLQNTAAMLRNQVCKLKEGVMEHVKSGCQVMLAQQLAF